MSNAKIILKAIGEQDSYLNINPQNTYFKSAHKTHTQFGTSWLSITNNNKNNTTISPGGSLYFRIPVDGDLINETFLRIKVNTHPDWLSTNFGNIRETIFGLLDSVEFLIHDKVIVKMDSDYIFAYLDIHSTYGKLRDLGEMISYDNQSISQGAITPDYTYLTIPLPFWFHNNPGLAFPIWSLNDANLGIKVHIKPYVSTANTIINDIELLTQFTYLSPEEKEKFKNLPLEYIIEQPVKIESMNITKSLQKIDILHTHFVKYMIWFIKNPSNTNWLYSDYLTHVNLSANGNSIIESNNSKYFSTVNRYQFFNCGGTLNLDTDFNIQDDVINPIYIYSFALEPSLTKVSGFITSDKFNQFTLELGFSQDAITNNCTCETYIIKHNIIRIKDGHLNILFN